jgi:hypothetical protein
MENDCLNVIGLILNILGTIILAFSLTAFLKAIKLSLNAIELERLSEIHPTKPSLKVTGTDVHVKNGERKSNFLLWLGIILVILGFIFQLIPYLIK